MSTGIYPGLQMRIDEARRHAELPTTPPPVMSYLRRLHLPHLHLRRHVS